MKSWFTHRSVLLAIAVFFQAEGLLLVSGVQQFFHGFQMRMELKNENNHFQILNLPLDTYIHSKINNHEISLNGEMYDVRSVDICNDNVSLLVLHDQTEENLLSRIGDYFRNDPPQKNNNPISLYQLLTEKYIAPAQSHRLEFPLIKAYSFSFLSKIFKISIPEFPGPPPKLS